ncbi:saccharopine dehydrogenase NADP-binding domain-containing protein [Schleiferiaceae bacterium]|nr:saccharopine dehydrogenase NADP-binding domain-containing protein [Schleiferiaceae bacterium]
MTSVLLIGAGLSTQSLVPYLTNLINTHDISLRVVDQDVRLAASRVREPVSNCSFGALDIRQIDALESEVRQADVTISMVPAHMHLSIAKACLKYNSHLLTASYLTPEMEYLHDQVKKEGLVFLSECGLDPGIDHMSAMQLLNNIRDKGGTIKLFESFTGGLLSPSSEGSNPWRYKFTWNPRNVVLAGQGGAVKFIQEGKYKYIPPHMVFRRTEFIDVEGYGRFEGLANRDSLKYRDAYGLNDVDTLYRGTLRRPGYARAWDSFVKLGMTDDSYVITGLSQMSFRDYTNLFLAYNPHDSVELKIKHYLNIPQDSEIFNKLRWAGLFSNETFEFDEATPAQCLEYILRKVWTMQPDDKDLIVMFHKIGWQQEGQMMMIESSMGVEGTNADNTAMAGTVGLPLGIAARLVIEGEMPKGVLRPLTKDWYDPILDELARKFNVKFSEKNVEYAGY